MLKEINSYSSHIISLQHTIYNIIKIDPYLENDIVRDMNLSFRTSFEAYTHDHVNAEVREHPIL